jgi:Zn-dependent alcohol dehydrogenase
MKVTAAVSYGPQQAFDIVELELAPHQGGRGPGRARRRAVSATQTWSPGDVCGRGRPMVLGHEGSGVCGTGRKRRRRHRDRRSCRAQLRLMRTMCLLRAG